MNLKAASLIGQPVSRSAGQPVDRAEDLRFLKGAGKFVDDLKRFGMLHAAILRSSVAHGRIRGLDASCRFRKLSPFDSRSAANQNMIAE